MPLTHSATSRAYRLVLRCAATGKQALPCIPTAGPQIVVHHLPCDFRQLEPHRPTSSAGECWRGRPHSRWAPRRRRAEQRDRGRADCCLCEVKEVPVASTPFPAAAWHGSTTRSQAGAALVERLSSLGW